MPMIECKRCHKDTEVSQERYDSLIRRKKLPLCHDCKSEIVKETLAKQTPEERAARYNKASQSHKDNWASLTEEERTARAKAAQEGIHNMSDEKKALRSKHSSEATRRIMANLTDAQRAERSQKVSEANYRRYANMSDIERYELGRKISEGQLAISEERKAEANQRRSESMKAYISGLSNKELENRNRNAADARWKITREEFEKIELSKAIINNTKSNANGATCYDALEATEIEFADMLKSRGIKNFRYQYYSIKKYPDFDKLFPKNPISGSEFISPYHKWDFKVICDNGKEIFIDVDGSSHKPMKVSDTHPTGLNMNTFRDTLRPYQTDDLDSYSIICHDNTISYKHEVKNIKTGESMSVETLLMLINSYMNTDLLK